MSTYLVTASGVHDELALRTVPAWSTLELRVAWKHFTGGFPNTSERKHTSESCREHDAVRSVGNQARLQGTYDLFPERRHDQFQRHPNAGHGVTDGHLKCSVLKCSILRSRLANDHAPAFREPERSMLRHTSRRLCAYGLDLGITGENDRCSIEAYSRLQFHSRCARPLVLCSLRTLQVRINRTYGSWNSSNGRWLRRRTKVGSTPWFIRT